MPSYKVDVVFHKHKSSGHITYDKMGKYIAALKESKELIPIFEKVKEYAHSQPFPYIVVENWFKKSFPDYANSEIQFDKEGFPIVKVNVAHIKENAEKISDSADA